MPITLTLSRVQSAIKDSIGIDVACGEGVLRLKELRRAGGRRQAAEQFVQGWRN